MKKRIGIIGAGRFGQALIAKLIENGTEIVLIDKDAEKIRDLADSVANAVQGDATNIRALKEAGFENCDTAIICVAEEMDVSLLSTVHCKELGIKEVIAKAESDTHGKILERVGADRVIYPYKDRAESLAKEILRNLPIDITEIADGLSIAEIDPPKDIIGKTIIDAGVRQKYGYTVLAIRQKQEDKRHPRITVVATGRETINADDKLIIFGDNLHLNPLS